MRTFAMRVYIGAYLAHVAIFLYELVILVLLAFRRGITTWPVSKVADPEAAVFALIFAVFLALFAAATVAAMLWRSAPRKAWFWLVAMLPGVAFYLLFARWVLYDLVRPDSVPGFPFSFSLTISTVTLLIAGIASALDARHGAPAGAVPRSPWTRFAVVAVVAAAAGALLASAGASTLSATGNSSAEIPKRTTVLVAKDTKFVGVVEAISGEALGLLITNQDSFDHSFDIDALNIHVRLPAKGTAAVVLRADQAGMLEYYCGVPSHKEWGMVGALVVR